MLNAQKTALALSGFLVVVHIVWSIVVALGLGQLLINFVMMVHFIKEPITVLPFDLGTAVVLLIVVGIVGYVAGYAFATISNKVHKR